jgi:hypothetical protein
LVEPGKSSTNSRHVARCTAQKQGKEESGLSTIATTADTPASRTPEGIAAIILGMLLFVFQDAMMKSLLGAFPVWPLLLVRAVVCSLVMVPLILYLGPPHRILWRRCRRFFSPRP